MKNVLITGCFRFVLKKLQDVRIITLDKLTYAGNPENLSDIEGDYRSRSVKGDICNADLVERVFEEEQIDTVVHCAAESQVGRIESCFRHLDICYGIGKRSYCAPLIIPIAGTDGKNKL